MRRPARTDGHVVCIPPGSAVIYRTIVYVITYLMAGLVLRKRSAKAASVFG
jgi:agmatinase